MAHQESFFDDYGRVIPKGLTAPAHDVSRRYFSFPEIDLDLDQIYSRITRHLDISEDVISLETFKARVEKIRKEIVSNESISGIQNGIGIPFIVPQQKDADIGELLERRFLPAVEASYRECFPDYSFVNHNTDRIVGNLQCSPESRHSTFMEAVETSTVVGILFPCLTEFSIPAAVEQVSALPKNFLLGGAFDTCAAFIGCPELLFKPEGYPPLIWMSGISGPKDDVGYHFEAYGYNLTFNRRAHLGHVAEYWASSLVRIVAAC